MTQQTIRAAGGIVYREVAPRAGNPWGVEVCAVHRTKYGDLSFPKGKLEASETPMHAAVREIGEETGLSVALEATLPSVRYDLAYEGKPQSSGLKERGITKAVDYWVARQIGPAARDARAHPFGPIYHADEGEISDVVWLTPAQARAQLTRPNDRELLGVFLARMGAGGVGGAIGALGAENALSAGGARKDTHGAGAGSAFGAPGRSPAPFPGTAMTTTFLVIRHGKAESRKTWHAGEATRPLTPMGAATAYALTREMACFAPEDLYSSPWKRCADTIGMYAMQSGQEVTMAGALTEDAFAADPGASWDAMRSLMARCAQGRRPAAVCMHRPVIGGMIPQWRALCLAPEVAALLPSENPYMSTGTALALSLVWAEGAPRIAGVQKVSPLVY